MFIEQIKQTVNDVRNGIIDDPGRAKAIYRVQIDLVEGVKCVATAQSSNPLKFEEPPAPKLGLGCSIHSDGKEMGMVPTELYLASVGSCLAIGLGMFAAMRDVVLDQVTIKLSGHLDLRGFLENDNSVSPGFSKIEFEAIVRSEAPDDVLREIARLALERSPIMVNVTEEIEMGGTVSLNNVKFNHEAAAPARPVRTVRPTSRAAA